MDPVSSARFIINYLVGPIAGYWVAGRVANYVEAAWKKAEEARSAAAKRAAAKQAERAEAKEAAKRAAKTAEVMRKIGSSSNGGILGGMSQELAALEEQEKRNDVNARIKIYNNMIENANKALLNEIYHAQQKIIFEVNDCGIQLHREKISSEFKTENLRCVNVIYLRFPINLRKGDRNFVISRWIQITIQCKIDDKSTRKNKVECSLYTASAYKTNNDENIKYEDYKQAPKEYAFFSRYNFSDHCDLYGDISDDIRFLCDRLGKLIAAIHKYVVAV